MCYMCECDMSLCHMCVHYVGERDMFVCVCGCVMCGNYTYHYVA